MEAIKNRYDFVFLFDVKDEILMVKCSILTTCLVLMRKPIMDLVTDVCIKRKNSQHVQLSKGFESPIDIFIGKKKRKCIEFYYSEIDRRVIKKIKDEGKTMNADMQRCAKNMFQISLRAVMSTEDGKRRGD